MSLDIHYHTCNFDTRVMKRNRVTGKMQYVAVADTLAPAEQEAVLGLLRTAGAVRPDKFGSYVVVLPDGGRADIRPSVELESQSWAGILVYVHVLTAGTARLLWDFCEAGKMAAVPTSGDHRNMVLVASEDCRMRAGARWSAPLLIDSPDEFYWLLRNDSALQQTIQNDINDTPPEPHISLGGNARPDEPRIRSSDSKRTSSRDETSLDLAAEAADILRIYCDSS